MTLFFTRGALTALSSYMFLGLIFKWSLRGYAYNSTAIITVCTEVDIPTCIDRMIAILPYLTIVPASHKFVHVDNMKIKAAHSYISPL